jgi:hypothetical protein
MSFLMWITGFLFLCIVNNSKGDELADLLRDRQLRQDNKVFKELEKKAAMQDAQKQKPESQMEPEAKALDQEQYKKAAEKADYQRRQAKLTKKQKLAALGPNPTKDQKQEIENEYKNTLALIELDLRYEEKMASLSPDEKRAIGELAESSAYEIRAIQLIGNTLIQTEEVLGDIPLIFRYKDDITMSSRVYDLYALKKAVLLPGQSQRVTQESIQGLTQYILSLYKAKGFGGIYVYVPAEIVKEDEKEREGMRLEKDTLVIKICNVPL